MTAKSIVQSSFLAIALIFVGALLFKEQLTWNKIVGVVICMAWGLLKNGQWGFNSIDRFGQ